MGFVLRGRIAGDHPALSGHFPGRPIVPGVVLLSEVERAVRAACGSRAAAWPRVKFTSALLPERGYAIALDLGDGGDVRFTITSGQTTIATGAVELVS